MSRDRQDRPLPHSKQCEVAFLGGVLLSDGSGKELDLLSCGDFMLPQHRKVFQHLQELRQHGKPTNDVVLLYESLDKCREIDEAGGIEYLSKLSDGLPHVSNIKFHAEQIRNHADARALIYDYQAKTERLMCANGNLPEVLREITSAGSVKIRQSESTENVFRTAADLADESSKAEFIVEPYIAAGAVTELVAKIKAGKTTYLLGEIVRKALAKGPAVYLTEQPPASFRVALERAGLLSNEKLFVLPFTAVIGRQWEEITRIVAEKCKETKAVLLVVDTLSHFCGLSGDSENDSGAAIAAMKPLQEIAATGVAVVDSRHERKGGGEIGDSGRGSTAFGGAADTLLTLRRTEGRSKDTLRKIECVSRFDGLPSEAIYEFENGQYHYRGTENEISEREAEEQILAAVSSQDNAKTLDELIDGSDVARTTAQRVAKRLRKTGKLQQIGRGKKGDPFRYFIGQGQGKSDLWSEEISCETN